MVAELQRESVGLKALIEELSSKNEAEDTAQNFERFCSLIRQHSQIAELDHETLVTFIDRIEVGPKIFSDGRVKATHRNQPFKQSIRIFYKFIGEASSADLKLDISA